MSSIVIPTDLKESLRLGLVNLFVGAGVSSAANLISWDRLVKEMHEVILVENSEFPRGDLERYLESASHTDIADLFQQTVGLHPYFRFIRKHYRTDVPISRLHKVIAKLPIKTIFTTNYDKLLETAFRTSKGIDPAVIVFPEQLNYVGEEETRIIKIHGDIDHPRTIVLTRSDYAEYAVRHPEFVNLLQSSINGRTLLFVGFGLRDPNFTRIYSDARSFFDSTNRQAYAFMTNTNAVERHRWREEHLTIIPLQSHRQLPNVIASLCR